MKEHLVSEYYENLIKLIDKAEEKHLKRDQLIEKLANLSTSIIKSYLESIADTMNIDENDISLIGEELDKLTKSFKSRATICSYKLQKNDYIWILFRQQKYAHYF